MLESQPELAPQLRRVRGGYLKIQGTWMPYEVRLSSRVHSRVLHAHFLTSRLRCDWPDGEFTATQGTLNNLIEQHVSANLE